MELFQGMQVEHLNDSICLHIDKCIQDALTEYTEFSAKPIKSAFPAWDFTNAG
jgi:hypothetical protein